jgi:hypothetical protein
MIYVLALMFTNPESQRDAILDAIQEGSWYPSAIAAGATMDQNNGMILEHIPEDAYFEGRFMMFGVFKLELAGLVTNYEV